MVIKKVLVVSLAIACVLSISGCGTMELPAADSATGADTAENEMTIALEQGMPDIQQISRVVIEKAESIRSIEQNAVLIYDMTLKNGEHMMSMIAQAEMTSQVTKNPYVVKSVTRVNMANTSEEEVVSDKSSDPGSNEITVTSTMYAEKTGDKQLTIYTRNDAVAADWTKMSLVMPEQEYELFDVNLFKLIESGEKEAVLEPERESVDGKECYVIKTVLDYDTSSVEVLSLLQQMGMPEEVVTGDVLNDIRINTIMWIDTETGLPVMYEQDLTEAGNKLLNSLFGSQDLSSQGDTGENREASAIPADYQFEFGKYTATTRFTGFNTIDRIIIPEEARNARELNDYEEKSAEE